MKQLIFILVISAAMISNINAQFAPNFTITDTDGNTHRLYEDYLDKGSTVVIDIFFVGCPPCADLAPFIQESYEEWGSGEYDVQFFEFSNKQGDSNADVAGWKNSLGTSYPGAGNDGGAYSALQPYISSNFGQYYGAPTLVVIAPDRTVNFNITGPGVSGKIEALNNAIAATGAQGPGDLVMPSNFEFDIKDAFGNPVTDVTVTIASADQIGASYDLTASDGDVLSILNFDDQFPGVTNPTFFFSKQESNAANKISTIDIITILKHIINVQPLDNNDLVLAADANNDGAVSSIDLITLQKLVLGIILNYPNGNLHWKSFPESQTFNIIPNATQAVQLKMIRIGDMNDF